MECAIRFLFFVLSLVAFAGAAGTFGREYGVAYLSRSSEVDAFNALAFEAEAFALPFSSRGMRELFMTCARVRQGLIRALQPAKTQAAVDSACVTWAHKTLQRNPTYSAAHTIVMTSSAKPSDVAGALVLSQMTAPRESWQARMRLQTGLPLFGTGQDDLDRAVTSDISFLVQSGTGRIWLAALYDRDKTGRPVIVDAIDRRPDDEKSAFVKEVLRLGED